MVAPFLLVVAPAQAVIGGPPLPEVKSPYPYPNPYGFVGRIHDTNDNNLCTASLIRDDLALTSYHCVDEKIEGDRFGEILITFGQLNKERVEPVVERGVVYAYSPNSALLARR